jgi:hypothetical protein
MGFERDFERKMDRHDRMIRYCIRTGGKAYRPLRLKQITLREMVLGKE